MIPSIALVLLFANASPGEATAPRQADPAPAEQHREFAGTPTDPLFDKQFVATDDPAFILAAVESSRQAMLDAHTATEDLVPQHLRDAAAKIGRQNDATNHKLVALAQAKGWRLPDNNPMRRATLGVPGAPRTNANFIVNQIAFHEATLAQYRAQIDGKGDPQLRRTLREQLPGYQKNLEMLLKLKP